ncbi:MULTISPECIES: ubiquinol-cytochrome c reductase iron-sulfur subunit [unclassified Guyparkeria]|uniref:ubiquinol-cytochrome c reductase iron-sulfur subunit n=1 Tax=unclassified Guyparkeria TaxID=2626246 RepID=UPI000733630A|nr:MULTISPECIES: ubiquinol-cytochrome c reductase iron-sulfur subunit [unclassified Guyparkeria]KTG17805.1 ubiquinol-cytochrome c reductase iron-sulfur subunit [Guyparkeria sp. XI15]OAE89516.1 ubiquinol-cytochrome c reductase iron-sulfur subunit [Guyparkeria sp. WRN-7]
MADSPSNPARRRFLTGAATAVGAVGVGFAAVPFLSSFQPSAKAQAAGAPVDVNVGKLAPGQMTTVAWRGKPVYVVHRTERMLETLPEVTDKLRDPDSAVESQQPAFATNLYRAREENQQFLVIVGLCTHLGCAPTYRPEVAPEDLGEDWKGGFFCPCHGSKFDLSGRVYKGVPAPTNLEVPQYTYVSEQVIRVGGTEEEAA